MAAEKKKRCAECKFCEQIGRMQTQQGRLGRKKYYCNNPSVNQVTDNRFIGFGEMGHYSELALKTTKKWCPLNSNVVVMSKDQAAKNITDFISMRGYTYSVQELIDSYVSYYKEGYYTSHTTNDCITHLIPELETLLSS